MKRVKFIRNTVPEREGGPGYKKGDVVDMNFASAARWQRRSAIEVLDNNVGGPTIAQVPVEAIQTTAAPDPLFDAVPEPVVAVVAPAPAPVEPPAPVAAPAPAPVVAPTPHRTTLSVPRKTGGSTHR